MNDCDINAVNDFYMIPFPTSRINSILLFIGFLSLYLLATVGNVILTTLVWAVPQLHTPMYFFLCNLSSIDVIYVSTILPKMLSIIISEDKTISFYGCMTQLFFFMLCGNADIYILTFMAYDRYVAVCSPLHYTLIMTRKVCWILMTFYIVLSIVNSMIFTILISKLSFCESNKIDHFFCEIIPLMVLSSSDTRSIKTAITVEDLCVVGFSLIFILTSYVRIIFSILRIPSSTGKIKAFSSCSSHIITVLLFYGPCIFMYMKPASKESKQQDKIFSMFYVAVVPMLNPFVYSLRNKEVLGAARKMTNVLYNGITLFFKKNKKLHNSLFWHLS